MSPRRRTSQPSRVTRKAITFTWKTNGIFVEHAIVVFVVKNSYGDFLRQRSEWHGNVNLPSCDRLNARKDSISWPFKSRFGAIDRNLHRPFIIRRTKNSNDRSPRYCTRIIKDGVYIFSIWKTRGFKRQVLLVIENTAANKENDYNKPQQQVAMVRVPGS